MPKNGFAGMKPSMVYVTQDNSRNARHSCDKQTNAIIKQREQLDLSENMKMYKTLFNTTQFTCWRLPMSEGRHI